MAIRKVCVASGCDDIAIEGLPHCDHHEERRLAKLKDSRANAKLSVAAKAGSALYRNPAWRKASKVFLQRFPLCADCDELGVVEPAVHVDHVERHCGDRVKFWDQTNWQSLCHRCHSRKTAREVFHGK